MQSHVRALMSVGSMLGMTLAAGASSPGAVSAEHETINELQTQISQLRTRLAALEQPADGEAWLTERRAEEVRALMQDVLADADTRASLLQSGMTAGHDGRFFLASSDGNFRLNVKGQIQVRYVYNFQDEGLDRHRSGFENRRTKLEFSGHMVDPTWQYKIKGGFDRDGGSLILEDAYVTKDFENGWEIQVGQYKPPFLREELVSSSKLLLVERSLVNEERNQDFAQGVQLGYAADQFRFAAMISDGFGSRNVGALTEDVEFALTGRAELLLAGNWKQFEDFTSWQGEEFGFLFGGAAHYQKAEYGTVSGPEEEEFMWTLDASAEFGGANLFAAIVGRHLDVADADRYGIVVQGGVFLTEDWEIFGRYEWYDYDATSVEDLNTITVGVNRYWKKHNLKWTTDLGFGLDEVNPVFSSSGAGWRGDPADEDGQVVFRSQLQLLF